MVSAAAEPRGTDGAFPRLLDLLIISDLHLDGDSESPSSKRRQAALVGFLDHHRADEQDWRLVINGDMFDLQGVTVRPAEIGLEVGFHSDDLAYGVGGSAAAARLKTARVVACQGPFLAALGRWLAAGHPISIVIGNHDVELFWPGAQAVLTEALVAEAVRCGGKADVCGGLLSFHGWFFLEEGLCWVEHGHQYDPYCSFDEVLAPATDGREIDPNLGALLPRYIGPHMGEDIHDAWGMTFVGYLGFWGRQGSSRVVNIGRAYIDVVRRMVELWRARRPRRLLRRRLRARARLRRVARALRLPEPRLRQLARLRIPPVSMGLLRILRALMVDRLALLIVGPILVLLPFLLLPWELFAYGMVTAAVPIGLWGWSSLMRREPVDPSDTMAKVAGRIRDIAGVPLVTMGHSHAARAEGDALGAYFNTGHWFEGKAAGTHLKVERLEGGARAQLCQWRDGASHPFPEAGVAAVVTVKTPTR